MKDKKDNLAAEIVFSTAKGKIKPDAMGAMLSVLAGAPVLRPTTDPVTGERAFDNVIDQDGNLLVAGGVYLLREQKVKVLREEFGSGNVMDTYYRVFYLNSDFQERFVVVDARFDNGIFGPRVYKSAFKKVSS